MGWKDMDTRTPDERTNAYFRGKMESDRENRAFWSATAQVTAKRWHLDQWEDAELDTDTREWLEGADYFGATEPFERDVVRRLVFLDKHNAQKLYRDICLLAQEMERKKTYKVPGKEGRFVMDVPLHLYGGDSEDPSPPPATPPPTPAPVPEPAVKSPDARQRTFILMLLWQWQQHYGTGSTPPDAEAAKEFPNPNWRDARSQANSYNLWLQKLPKELRPVRTTQRGGRRK